MKIYVWDHGWDGAEIVIAESRKEAAVLIFDRYVDKCLDAYKNHIEAEVVYGRPVSYNRHMWEAISYLEDGEKMLDEYEITKNLKIRTEGG